MRERAREERGHVCVHALVQHPQSHHHVCHVSPCLGTLWAPQQPQEVARARASLVLWGRGVRGLCALRPPGRVTLMGQGRRVPGWVPGQPHCGHMAPQGELGRGHRLGMCPCPPPASDPARHSPRGHLCHGWSTGGAAQQSPPHSLRLSIAIFVIEIPFTR